MSTSFNEQSFTDLIALAQAGDQEAIAALYNRTYSAVYHTTKALIRDEDTALDVLQDAYIKGFQNLDRLRQPEQFQAWMKMIATNTAKNMLKRKRPTLFSEMENEDGEMEVEFVDDRAEHLPEVAMDKKETSRLVSEILDTLPDDQRLVLGMFYYEEMTVQQIAAILGVSENTVKSRLNYGRKKVEAKVRDLEKRGTKLYSLAPLPFLLLLFRGQASAAEMPSAALLETITAKAFSGTAAAAGKAAAAHGGKYAAQGAARSAAKAGARAAGTTAVKAAATGGAKMLAVKIAAGVLAVGLAGGGMYYGAATFLGGAARRAETALSSAVTMASEAGQALLDLAPDVIVPEITVPESTVSEGTEPTVTVQETAALPAAAAAADPRAAYQQVIQDYAQELSVDSGTYLDHIKDHEAVDVNQDVIIGYHEGRLYVGEPHYTCFYYAHYDINHDGTDELLICMDQDHFGYHVIIDVRSFDGANAVKPLGDRQLGSFRGGVTIHQDGSLHYTFALPGDVTDEWYTIQGTALVSSAPSDAPEAADIPWQPLEPAEADAPAEVSGEWVSAYEAVLRDYRGIWEITWETNSSLIGQEQQLYPNARGSDITLNHTTEQLCWATKDLDGNGTPELFIGMKYGGVHAGEEPHIYDVFTVINGRPFHLISDEYSFSFDVLADGTLVGANYMFGTVEHVMQIGPDGTTVDIPDALMGQDLWNTDLSAHGGKLTGLDWHPLDQPLVPSEAGQLSFDSIRADIRAACAVKDFDSKPDYYYDRFANLGRGAAWALCNREVPKEAGIGSLYYNVFCTEFDIDHDGETELCVSKGVTVQRAQVIVIYDRTPDGIVPIFGEAISPYLAPYEFGILPVEPGAWDHITWEGEVR